MDFHKTQRRMYTGDEQHGELQLHPDFVVHSSGPIKKLIDSNKKPVVTKSTTQDKTAARLANSVSVPLTRG